MRCFVLEPDATRYDDHVPLEKGPWMEDSRLDGFGGLFCQRIFGPVRDRICACGKYDANVNPRDYLKWCEVCGVDVGSRELRLKRFGVIPLAREIPHPWWPKQTLQAVPVIPPHHRGEPAAEINELYIGLLRDTGQVTEADLARRVGQLFGEPRPIEMPTMIYVEQLPVPNLAAFLEHKLKLLANAVHFPADSDVRTLLEGTHDLRFRADSLAVRPEGAPSDSRELRFLKSFDELLNDMNARPRRHLSGVPESLKDLQDIIWAFGCDMRFAPITTSQTASTR
jgi:hypothetical protein